VVELLPLEVGDMRVATKITLVGLNCWSLFGSQGTLAGPRGTRCAAAIVSSISFVPGGLLHKAPITVPFVSFLSPRPRFASPIFSTCCSTLFLVGSLDLSQVIATVIKIFIDTSSLGHLAHTDRRSLFGTASTDMFKLATKVFVMAFAGDFSPASLKCTNPAFVMAALHCSMTVAVRF